MTPQGRTTVIYRSRLKDRGQGNVTVRRRQQDSVRLRLRRLVRAHNHTAGIRLLRHRDKTVAEVDLVALVLGIRARLAVVHLRRTRRLEHTIRPESEARLILAG